MGVTVDLSRFVVENQRQDGPPARGMSRSDKGSAVCGEQVSPYEKSLWLFAASQSAGLLVTFGLKSDINYLQSAHFIGEETLVVLYLCVGVYLVHIHKVVRAANCAHQRHALQEFHIQQFPRKIF